ncbi:hypothetical protein LTR95_013503 [Oleoguttula sp. CCFEE 5521]
MSSGDDHTPGTPDMHQEPGNQPDTLPSNQMTAAATVFALPELLETHILHLDDWKQPFVLLSINRCFQQAIEDSLPLRRKMWLAPDPAIAATIQSMSPDPNGNVHSECYEIFNPLLCNLSDYLIDCPWDGGDGHVMEFRLDFTRCVPAYGGRPDENFEPEINVAVYDGNASGISFDSMRISKGTTWRKTLCFQRDGPIQTTFCIIPCVHDSHAYSTRKNMEPDTTLGTFIDAAAAVCYKPSGIKCPHEADYGYDSDDSYEEV